MLTVDSIHDWSDVPSVISWTFLVMGVSYTVFFSEWQRWMWGWLAQFDVTKDYEQFRWQLAHGITRYVKGKDTRGRHVFEDTPLTEQQIVDRLAFIDNNRARVWTFRLARVPFHCDFCASAWSAVVLMLMFGQGDRWLLSALMYASLAGFIGRVVRQTVAKSAGQQEADEDCPSCNKDRQAHVTITPSKLIKEKVHNG